MRVQIILVALRLGNGVFNPGTGSLRLLVDAAGGLRLGLGLGRLLLPLVSPVQDKADACPHVPADIPPQPLHGLGFVLSGSILLNNLGGLATGRAMVVGNQPQSQKRGRYANSEPIRGFHKRILAVLSGHDSPNV